MFSWFDCLNAFSIFAISRKFWVLTQKPLGDYEGSPSDAIIVHDFSGFCDELPSSKEEPLGDAN